MFEDVSLLSDTKQLSGVSQFQVRCTDTPVSVNSIQIDTAGMELKNVNIGEPRSANDNCQCCPGVISTFQCCPVVDPLYAHTPYYESYQGYKCLYFTLKSLCFICLTGKKGHPFVTNK